MKYEYYIFDMYGTLADIHTDERAAATWKKWIKKLDELNIKHPDYIKMRRDFFDADKNARKERAFETGSKYPEIDVIKIYEEMLINYGNDKILSCQQKKDELLKTIAYEFRQASRAYIRPFACDFSSEPCSNVFIGQNIKCPDTIDTMYVLNYLKNQGGKLFLLSNAQSSYTLPEIKLLGIDEIMDGMLISSDTGYMKPDRYFYDILINTYKINPSRAVMFGDSMLSDVEGARAAGIAAVHTPKGIVNAFVHWLRQEA